MALNSGGMAQTSDRREREVFEKALERAGGERKAYLQQACAGAPELERKVRCLLAAHQQTQRAPTRVEAPEPAPTGYPERIGSYRLLERIGEGGMGVVYVAEQAEPVRRKVALKLIKAGMDTREVIARFHSERQALALMNHPNIARILEAGATEGGRPYFVMEYVPGMPLLEYCDQQRLDVGQRLALFVDVCRAVQHAHQKGVIHRDLKPSNILIKEEDGRQTPKVIDFGVAKAISSPLSDLTVHTRLGGFIGTPEYVSPEQARMTGLDVDTRADVYSLGAVLYELLTGARPFDFSDPGMTLAEIQKSILEEDPQPSSVRVAGEGEASRRRAGRRQADPPSLARTLRHDLDWVLMKALEKDRNRRYSSASELAADVERYLARQPVAAGPRSARYRLGRFVGRHRGLLLAGAAGIVLLLGGILGTTLGLLQARREAERARVQAAIAQEVNRFLNEDLLAAVAPQRQGIEVSMREVLEQAARRIEGRFAAQPLVEASLRHTIGLTYRRLGVYTAAEPHLQRAAEIRRRTQGLEHAETLQAVSDLGILYRLQARYGEAEPLHLEVLEAQRRVLGDAALQTLISINGLGVLYEAMGRYREAEAFYLECLEGRQRLLGRDDPATLAVINNLSILYQVMHRWGEAERLQLEALEVENRIFGPEHPSTLNSIINVSALYLRQERYDEAEAILTKSLGPIRRVMGDEHPRTLMMMNNLGYLYSRQARYDEAEALLLESLAIKRRVLGEEHPSTVEAVINLRELYRDMGAVEKLARYARQHLRTSRRLAEGPDATVKHKSDYAALLLSIEPTDLRDPGTALKFAREANEATEFGDAAMLETLARAYFEVGDSAQAIATIRKALAASPDESSTFHGELERTLVRYAAARGQ